MKKFLFIFGLFFVSLTTFAGTGDYSPSRSGINQISSPSGTGNVNSFNNFVDDTFWGALGHASLYAEYAKGGTPSEVYTRVKNYASNNGLSSYLDERNFTRGKIGTSAGTYSHSVSSTLTKGSKVRVQVLVHNNATEFPDDRNRATNTKVTLNVSDILDTKAIITANNASTVSDIVNFNANNSGSLSFKLTNTYLYSAGSINTTTGSQSGGLISLNLANVPGCYNDMRIVYFDLEVVDKNYCGDGTIQNPNHDNIAEVCDDGANNGQPGFCNNSCTGTIPADNPSISVIKVDNQNPAGNDLDNAIGGNSFTNYTNANAAGTLDKNNITKTSFATNDSQTIQEGGTAKFKIIVINDGNVDLTNVTVTDNQAGHQSCEKTFATFPKNTIQVYTCEKDDVTSDYVNTIAVSGTANGTTVSAADRTEIIVSEPVSNASISILKIDQQLTDDNDLDGTIGGDQNLTTYDLVDAYADKNNPGKTDFTVNDSQNIEQGGTSQFDIIVINDGDVDLTNLVFDDPNHPDCLAKSAAITTLSVGERKSFFCEKTDIDDSYINIISVTATPVDGSDNVSNGDASEVIVTGPLDNIVIEKIASKDKVKRDEEFTYVIAVTNNGQKDAEKITVTDTLPDGVEYVSGTSTSGTIVSNDNIITVSDITVAADQSIEIELTVKVSDTTTLDEACNIASVQIGEGADISDPKNTGDTDACVEITYLEIVKSADPVDGSTVKAGDTITYTLAVTNTAGEELTNVRFTDQLDDNLSFVTGSYTGDGSASFDVNTNTLTVAIGFLDANDAVTGSFQVTVKQSIDFCNTGNAFGDLGTDTKEANSNEVCHVTPTDDGGGDDGGSHGDPAVGTCTVGPTDGSFACTAQKPYEFGPGWDDYKDCKTNTTSVPAGYGSITIAQYCVLEWAGGQELRTCGADVGGSGNIDPFGEVTTENIAEQCNFIPTGDFPTNPDPVCEIPCPTCFKDDALPTILKQVKNLNSTDTTLSSETTVSKGENATYEITLNLDSNTTDIYEITGGYVKVYDILTPSLSIASEWNRTGLVDGDGDSTWTPYVEHGITHFGKAFDASEIDSLNNGDGTLEMKVHYDVNSDLATNDDTGIIANHAFARIIYDYKYFNVATSAWETGSFLMQAGEGQTEYCGVDPTINNGWTTDSSTLGSSATVKIVRPYLQVKNGGNIGFQDTAKITGTAEGIGLTGSSTSGRVISDDSTGQNFDHTEGYDLDQYKEFNGEGLNTAEYYEFLKRNAYEEVTKLGHGSKFKTTGNDDSGIYFLESGDLTISGNYNVANAETFIIENGDLIISADFKVLDKFPAFIVRDGNVKIHKDVEQMDGIYIVENASKGFKSQGGISKKQLKSNGSFFGDMSDLLDKRRYIGTDPATTLEPSFEINFDVRILEDTPPALEKFLGDEWKESTE